MLQFLITAGAMLVAMMVYTIIVFAFMHSKYYMKVVKKICEKIYDVDDL